MKDFLKNILPKWLVFNISKIKLHIRLIEPVIRLEFLSKKRQAPLSPRSNKIYQDLLDFGYARIEGENFKNIATYVEQEYLSRLSNQDASSRISISKNDSDKPMRYNDGYSKDIDNHIYTLSFRDSMLHDLFFDSDLIQAIESYARGKLYYRESPLVEDSTFNGSDVVTEDVRKFAAAYHSDNFRQINVMLLLTDVTPLTTCTEYARGSNMRNVLYEGVRVNFPRSNDLIKNGGYPIDKLIGHRGDVILMDTTGFHRASLKVNTNRRLLVGVLNPGFPFMGYGENLNSLNQSVGSNLIL